MDRSAFISRNCQALPHLRVFVYAVSSAWNSSPWFSLIFQFSYKHTSHKEATPNMPWYLVLPIPSPSLLPLYILHSTELTASLWLCLLFSWFIVQLPQGELLTVLFILCLYAQHIVNLQWIIMEWKQAMAPVAHRHKILVKKVNRKREYSIAGGQWVQTYQIQLNHTYFWCTNSTIQRAYLVRRRNTLKGTSLKNNFEKIDLSSEAQISFR